jgi:uncharacterized protein (TIGR00297 family)
MQFFIGFVLALAVAALARLVRSLSSSGAIAAAVLGTIVFGFGGWQAALVLITFFVSSSVLGRLTRPRLAQPEARYAKGAERDAGQVLGNGMVAGALAVAISINPVALWPWLGYAGAIAAVNADTWATEVGALSRTAPRLITQLRRRVPAGTSGGVSLVGTLAAASGAILIGSLSWKLAPESNAGMLVAVTVGGLTGAMLDSFLGATVQSMYRCVEEGVETEQHPVHRCGAATELIRGWSWLDNDRVNFACSLCGALVAVGLGTLAASA